MAAMKAEDEPTRVVKDAGDLARKIFDIPGRLRDSPYGMMAGAVGIGFVLGGGLFTRLTAKIVGAGIRTSLMAALPILERQLFHVFTESTSNNAKETDQ